MFAPPSNAQKLNTPSHAGGALSVLRRFRQQPDSPVGSLEATHKAGHGSPLAGGPPLAASTTAFFEPRLGHDFSRVRVDADAGAAQSARSVNALADTVGSHRLFRQKDSHKPQAPPPKTAPPATTAAATIPKLKSLTATITGSTGVREVGGGCQLMLGTRGGANGTTIKSQVDVPAGLAGTLQFVQLVDTCHTFKLSTGEFGRRKTGGYWIDTQDPIDEKPVTATGTVDFETDDSPGQPLHESMDHVIVTDSFKTWLMWKPGEPAGAHRVPLAMTTWRWFADARVKDPKVDDCDKRWAVTEQKASGETGKATKESPGATRTVKPGDPPVEKKVKDMSCG